MEHYDYLLLAVVGLLLVWQLAGLIATGRNVRVAGKMPGQLASFILFAALVAVAIYRNRSRMNTTLWIAFGAMPLVLVIFALMKNGLGDSFVYYRGKRYGYDQIEYYHVEREEGGSFILRLHTRRRDIVLQYPDEKKELVMAYLEKFHIMSFDAHKASGSSRR
ncbi:MAG: hypothetical protein IJU78_03670 [Clostridia bacterium]|nr:hypothetical protein [Clostridia bacterium]